jgi:hypothetical protein
MHFFLIFFYRKKLNGEGSTGTGFHAPPGEVQCQVVGHQGEVEQTQYVFGTWFMGMQWGAV